MPGTCSSSKSDTVTAVASAVMLTVELSDPARRTRTETTPDVEGHTTDGRNAERCTSCAKAESKTTSCTRPWPRYTAVWVPSLKPSDADSAARWYTPVDPMSDSSSATTLSDPLQLGYGRGCKSMLVPRTTFTVVEPTTSSWLKTTCSSPVPDMDAFGIKHTPSVSEHTSTVKGPSSEYTSVVRGSSVRSRVYSSYTTITRMRCSRGAAAAMYAASSWCASFTACSICPASFAMCADTAGGSTTVTKVGRDCSVIDPPQPPWWLRIPLSWASPLPNASSWLPWTTFATAGAADANDTLKSSARASKLYWDPSLGSTSVIDAARCCRPSGPSRVKLS
mmetsp:Transcript_21611/g.64410  ORF Transcript_21611/g.64410 Transcript_21611/m.64410 type:complete len:336 (+) Transcript_21611:595-1602(+)